MTPEEILRWEAAYEQTARLDFERRIYEQCAAEDVAAIRALPLSGAEESTNTVQEGGA